MDSDPLPTPLSGSPLFILLFKAIEFMAPPSWGGWIAIVAIAVLCLAMSAFVSGSEIAFFGLRPSEIDELEESEDANSKKAQKLLDNSEKLLATILISNNLVNITMVVLLTFAISQVTHFYSETLNFLVQTVFLTFLLLLFGEIFPKLVARGRALKWVRSASPALSLISSLTSPLANIMVRSTYFVNKFIRKKEDSISADELEKALEISDISEGKEKEMLEGILTFGDKEVSEIMISRVDVTAIEFHDSWDEAMRVILETGYSRIPVYDTSQDAIRGILYSKDLLPYIGNRDNSFRWQTLLREPYFVPESRMIDDLLEDFRKRKIHIAIVVDEYGGTSGIVTLEDIIEEIVGEIDDEYDEAQHLYRRIGPDTFIFDAKIPLSDFCHACGIEEEQLGNVGDAETLAGILLEIKGDFPTPGEKLSLGPCRFIVLEMEKHRILKVKTTIVEADSDDGN